MRCGHQSTYIIVSTLYYYPYSKDFINITINIIKNVIYLFDNKSHDT